MAYDMLRFEKVQGSNWVSDYKFGSIVAVE